jgi:membrane-associated protease RseP (regulator of RpoE activity)
VDPESDSEHPRAFDSPPRWERRRRWKYSEHPLFHLGLLLATFATTTIAGGAFTESGGLLGRGSFGEGLPFSIPVILILGIHEMGHYAMCRRHGVAATKPYFIPSPLLFGPFWSFGTFGAVIRIKEPIRDKRKLIEIGAAGPLAGFLASLPFLVYGVTRARPVKGANLGEGILFGYPILVRFAQDLTGAGRYTSAGVHEDPTFMAAWFGMLVTTLNLLPIGQLDGGHVARAALGRRQPILSYAVLLLAVLSAARSPAWAFFAVFAAVFVGVRHPPVENDDDPLPFRHQILTLACLGVFLLCFTPTPVFTP